MQAPDNPGDRVRARRKADDALRILNVAMRRIKDAGALAFSKPDLAEMHYYVDEIEKVYERGRDIQSNAVPSASSIGHPVSEDAA